MGLLRGFKLLWYTTVSLGFAYFGLSPILDAFGLGPFTGAVQGDIKLLLIITASILLGIVATVFVSGYLVLGGWRGGPAVPRKVRLLLAMPVGIAILILSGALSFLVPIPILPIIIAALLIWSILRFTSSQAFPPKQRQLDVDGAEELALKFWRSRNPEEAKPIPVSAILEGDHWAITMRGGERTAQLDIDARNGVVTGWRMGQ